LGAAETSARIASTSRTSRAKKAQKPISNRRFRVGYYRVGVGEDANLGTEGTYFVVRPFDGDTNAKLVAANPHIFGRKMRNAGPR
jgi:hypothetical protein